MIDDRELLMQSLNQLLEDFTSRHDFIWVIDITLAWIAVIIRRNADPKVFAKSVSVYKQYYRKSIVLLIDTKDKEPSKTVH